MSQIELQQAIRNEQLILPDRFIHLVEQNNLLSEINHWMINKSIKQEQLWQEAGLAITVSVNISAFDITSLMLPEQLEKLLNDNKLNLTALH